MAATDESTSKTKKNLQFIESSHDQGWNSREFFLTKFRGRDKRAYIAALRQAKIYPPRQAAAAAIHKVECRSARGLWQLQI